MRCKIKYEVVGQDWVWRCWETIAHHYKQLPEESKLLEGLPSPGEKKTRMLSGESRNLPRIRSSFPNIYRSTNASQTYASQTNAHRDKHRSGQLPVRQTPARTKHWSDKQQSVQMLVRTNVAYNKCWLGQMQVRANGNQDKCRSKQTPVRQPIRNLKRPWSIQSTNWKPCRWLARSSMHSDVTIAQHLAGFLNYSRKTNSISPLRFRCHSRPLWYHFNMAFWREKGNLLWGMQHILGGVDRSLAI